MRRAHIAPLSRCCCCSIVRPRARRASCVYSFPHWYGCYSNFSFAALFPCPDVSGAPALRRLRAADIHARPASAHPPAPARTTPGVTGEQRRSRRDPQEGREQTRSNTFDGERSPVVRSPSPPTPRPRRGGGARPRARHNHRFIKQRSPSRGSPRAEGAPRAFPRLRRAVI